MVFAGILIMIDDAFRDSSMLGICVLFTILFLIPAVALGRSAKEIDTMQKRIGRYYDVIIEGKEYIIDNIASAMRLSIDEVKSDLRFCIDNGYLYGIEINESLNEIIHNREDDNYEEYIDYYEEEVEQTREAECKNCGATNTISDLNDKCEYCKSMIV